MKVSTALFGGVLAASVACACAPGGRSGPSMPGQRDGTVVGRDGAVMVRVPVGAFDIGPPERSRPVDLPPHYVDGPKETIGT